ncbi:MAG: antitoxin Xre/MbcA/ParS toxin-binding domain-containing protein [Bacteroidota bacterium]
MKSSAPYGWSLGLRARSAAEASSRVRQGFSAAALDRLRQRLDLSPEETAEALGTSSRTLARRRKEGRLGAAESDRLYRLARLYERAVEVFESEDDARRWFRLPQWALGDRTPLAFARTEPGSREVEALLDRIDYGVLA